MTSEQYPVDDREFAAALLAWFPSHGRHDLPWQINRDPYHAWVSEIMLQQTRVKTVIPYFIRFMERFPEVAALAEARLDDVLHIWTGLGYYARARALHRCAQIIHGDYSGEFPADIDSLIGLPGIGRSTAGAILSLSHGQRHPILDGNVRRVLTRCMGIEGWYGERRVENKLWRLAERLTPNENAAEYNQAIMDLGATVCLRRNPHCRICPLAGRCRANRLGTQHELPSSRPKKALPLKITRFVMMENDQGEVFLQQRPPTGIWGGLWSFPECEPETDARQWIQDKLGYRVLALAEQKKLRHKFSHFCLDITPLHVQVDPAGGMIRETAPYCWFSFRNKQQLGLPAPVKQLIEQFNENSSGEAI